MEVMAYRDCRVAVEVLLSAVSSAKGKLQTFLVKRISSAGTGYPFSTKRTKNRRNWFDCLMNPLWKQKSPLWNRKNTVPLNNRHKWTWFYKWEGWGWNTDADIVQHVIKEEVTRTTASYGLKAFAKENNVVKDSLHSRTSVLASHLSFWIYS